MLSEFIEKLKQPFQSRSFVGRCLSSGGVLAFGGLIESLSRFARNIILARILAPEAFGLMATVMASIAAIEAFTQVGLRQSVIQNKHGAEEEFLIATWWISTLRGLFLYCIAFMGAPLISSFLNQPEATNVLRAGFLVLPISSLISPGLHVLEKELRFTKWMILTQGAAVIGIAVGIVMAFFLRNVWALLLAYITEAFLRTLFSFVFCPIKPILPLNRTYLREILTFSRRLFGLPILFVIYAQTDVFIVGKVLSLKHLGAYTLVRSFSDMLSTFFAKAVDPLVLPIFAMMQDHRDRLKQTLLGATKVIGVFAIPLTVFMALFSEHLLQLVYGQEYAALALPFSALCVHTLILIFSSLIGQIYFAIGRPNIHRTASIIRTAVYLVLIYPATKVLGLLGTSLTALIAMCVLLSVLLIYAGKIIDFSLTEYLSSWLPGIKASLFVIVPGVFIKMFFHAGDVVTCVIGILLCCAAWLYGGFSLGLISKDGFSLNKIK